MESPVVPAGLSGAAVVRLAAHLHGAADVGKGYRVLPSFEAQHTGGKSTWRRNLNQCVTALRRSNTPSRLENARMA
jgi:hypothetical protein